MERMLGPEEEELIGSGALDDDVGPRIRALIRGYLQRIASANGGWDILFRDPHDGRFWELTYPHGEMHGGGPPALQHVTEILAGEKYHLAQLKSKS